MNNTDVGSVAAAGNFTGCIHLQEGQSSAAGKRNSYVSRNAFHLYPLLGDHQEDIRRGRKRKEQKCDIYEVYLIIRQLVLLFLLQAADRVGLKKRDTLN